MTRIHPCIAVVSSDTLASLGLAGIVRSMMPHAEVCLFPDFARLSEADEGQFFHYFISDLVLLENARYFLERQHRTIVLVRGEDVGRFPQGFHTLNVCQDEEGLVRSFLRLANAGHGAHRPQSEAVRLAREGAASEAVRLTPREQEVLVLVVRGLINKEIAARLGVSLTTVISHRKNLTEKLGIKSVSGLTVYAVMHGLIEIDEI